MLIEENNFAGDIIFPELKISFQLSLGDVLFFARFRINSWKFDYSKQN